MSGILIEATLIIVLVELSLISDIIRGFISMSILGRIPYIMIKSLPNVNIEAELK